jgi:hypothetical protein
VTSLLAVVDGSGSELASWAPLFSLLIVFGVIVTALIAFGRGDGGVDGKVASFLLRTPNALERLTRVPGWAAATVGLGLYGLLVAGEGFYSDVAWHIALGRDKNLFTAPHTSIVLGLGAIFLAGLVGIGYASLQRVPTALQWNALRVPWSTLPLLALGGAALLGFPLDEIWHRTYGVDVTMWSPTHMLMILGASFSGLASWLVLAESGVNVRHSRWGRGALVVAAWLTLQGLSAPLGEFSFGVPQFQQIFHPLILCIAGGFALVAIRLVHGRVWALGITVVNFLLMEGHLLDFGGGDQGSPAATRTAGIFIASALVVELVALVVGTRRSVRFAVLAGVGVATFGLAGEWWWNQGAPQAWNANLLPDAVILGVLAAVGAALVGVAFARAAGQPEVPAETDRPSSLLVALGGAVVLVVLALPMPRHVGDVQASVSLVDAGERAATPLAPATEQAFVEVELSPPTAADEARWFQATSWQGGGLVLSDLHEIAPGRFRSEEPVPVGAKWKTLVRLHRGGELMTVPVFLPADPEIGKGEISAVDRTQPFESEKRYLLRETHGSGGPIATTVYALLALAVVAWIGAFALAGARLVPLGRSRTVTAVRGVEDVTRVTSFAERGRTVP